MNGYSFDYFQGVGPEFWERIAPFRRQMFLELYQGVRAEFDEQYLVDPYDPYSWHVVAKDQNGRDVGAVRMTSSEAGLTEPETVSVVWREEFADHKRHGDIPVYGSRLYLTLEHRLMGILWLYYKLTEIAAEIGGTEIVCLAKSGKRERFYKAFGAYETSVPQDVIYHKVDNWGPHHMLVLPLQNEFPESVLAMMDQFATKLTSPAAR